MPQVCEAAGESFETVVINCETNFGDAKWQQKRIMVGRRTSEGFEQSL